MYHGDGGMLLNNVTLVGNTGPDNQLGLGAGFNSLLV